MSDSNESLQIRVHGEALSPTIVFLPGIHGDWTLAGGLRVALKGRLRLAEFTYPRTVTWSLDDYAAAIESALAEKGITEGWLLGESFGSQLVWELARRGRFKIEGIILAGGFVRYCMPRVVVGLHWLMPLIPTIALRHALRAYGVASRFRFRNSPILLADVKEFVARRNLLDWQAIRHRLHLIRANDPRPVARNVRLPLYALTGAIDPIVPWVGVKPWLEKNCPGFRGARVIRRADHVVLATAPELAVQQILQWMALERQEAVAAK